MTNEEINKIIAEYCGWKREFNGDDEDPEWYWIPPNNPDGNGIPPDYCNDLNAMAEAEELLSNEQLQTYFYVLRPVVESTAKPGRGYVFTAKASQRAKAFVKTIEKWKK